MSSKKICTHVEEALLCFSESSFARCRTVSRTDFVSTLDSVHNTFSHSSIKSSSLLSRSCDLMIAK